MINDIYQGIKTKIYLAGLALSECGIKALSIELPVAMGFGVEERIQSVYVGTYIIGCAAQKATQTTGEMFARCIWGCDKNTPEGKEIEKTIKVFAGAVGTAVKYVGRASALRNMQPDNVKYLPTEMLFGAMNGGLYVVGITDDTSKFVSPVVIEGFEGVIRASLSIASSLNRASLNRGLKECFNGVQAGLLVSVALNCKYSNSASGSDSKNANSTTIKSVVSGSEGKSGNSATLIADENSNSKTQITIDQSNTNEDSCPSNYTNSTQGNKAESGQCLIDWSVEVAGDASDSSDAKDGE